MFSDDERQTVVAQLLDDGLDLFEIVAVLGTEGEDFEACCRQSISKCDEDGCGDDLNIAGQNLLTANNLDDGPIAYDFTGCYVRQLKNGDMSGQPVGGRQSIQKVIGGKHHVQS